VSEFREATGGTGAAPGDQAAEKAEAAEAAVPDAPDAAARPAADESAVARALRELDTLPERELAEHPDVYQRIHAELQSALATIDNA